MSHHEELQCSNPKCQAVYPYEPSLVGSYCTACLWGQLMVPMLRHRGQSVRTEDDRGPVKTVKASDLLATRYNRRDLPATLSQVIGGGDLRGPEILRVGLSGPPSGGKTHLALEVVRDICRMGMSTLFVSAEMGVGALLADRLAQMEGPWGGLEVTDETNTYRLKDTIDQGSFDWVVVDSMLLLHSTPEWWFQSIGPSCILIFQLTKDGTFRGDQAWQHLCDLWVRCAKDGEKYTREVQKCWLVKEGAA